MRRHRHPGMSGGLAYLFDPNGKLPALCNVDVASDLFPVEESKDLVMLKSLLQRHVKYTGSSLGKSILANWDEAHKSFVKVGSSGSSRWGMCRSGAHVTAAGRPARRHPSTGLPPRVPPRAG